MITVEKDKKVHYCGEIYKGEACGKGKINYPNGITYFGTFKGDKWHGYGTSSLFFKQSLNSDHLTNSFRLGTYTWADGSRTEGEFADGDFHGKHTAHYNNGSIFNRKYDHDHIFFVQQCLNQ